MSAYCIFVKCWECMFTGDQSDCLMVRNIIDRTDVPFVTGHIVVPHNVFLAKKDYFRIGQLQIHHASS